MSDMEKSSHTPSLSDLFVPAASFCLTAYVTKKRSQPCVKSSSVFKPQFFQSKSCRFNRYILLQLRMHLSTLLNIFPTVALALTLPTSPNTTLVTTAADLESTPSLATISARDPHSKIWKWWCCGSLDPVIGCGKQPYDCT